MPKTTLEIMKSDMNSYKCWLVSLILPLLFSILWIIFLGISLDLFFVFFDDILTYKKIVGDHMGHVGNVLHML